ELDPVARQPRAHRAVPVLAVDVVVQVEDGGRDPGGGGALQRAGAGAVRRDRDDGQVRVDQRLEVRAGAADEHSDHATRPMTRWSPGSGRTATKPMPRLKTRRSSSSS